MSIVDHGQRPLDGAHLPVTGQTHGPGHRFRVCGARVGGDASRPVPTDKIFEPNLTAASTDLVVGVVDTGLAMQWGEPHPWLAGHVEFDDAAHDPIPDSPGVLGPVDGHGSFVTGLIVRQAPSATVRMIRAIDVPQDAAMTDAGVAAAIDALGSDSRVKVINLSFSGQTWEQHPPQGIQDALERLRGRDVVVVAAAGNNMSTDVVWPGAFENVIAVGAVDETSTPAPGALPPRASFSDHGEWVDAYASGVDVLGPFLQFHETMPDQTFNGWALWSGTSFAAAIVSGQIARRAIEDGIATPEAARRVLEEGCRFESHDFAVRRHPTYVQGVDSHWPVSRLA